MSENTNQSSRQVLALFVSARRKYRAAGSLTPVGLAKLVGVNAVQVRAVERQQNITHEAAVKLAAWCGLEWVGEAWVDIVCAHGYSGSRRFLRSEKQS